MKVLVTGAAGAIGSHVAERLARQGHDVVGIDCLTDYYDRALKEMNAAAIQQAGVALHRTDLVTDDIKKLLSGVQVVYHCAAQPGISAHVPFMEYERNNILATQRLLESLQGIDSLELFVNVATSSIYGTHADGPETMEPQPTSNYGVTKLAAEQLVMARQREEEFPAASLRLFSVYGERERPEKLYHKLIRSMLHDESFPLHEGSREHRRSYTYVGDIVDGMLAVLEKKDSVIGEIINLGTDETHTTGEGIDMVETILGKHAHFVMRPPRPGDQKETAAHIDKARRLLGYAPRTSLREGLERQVRWCQEIYHT